MTISIPKIFAKATEHLANREQRLVTLVFLFGAILYLGSYVPNVWSYMSEFGAVKSDVVHFFESLTWQIVIRDFGVAALMLSTGSTIVIAYMRLFNARWDDLQGMYFLKGHSII